VLAAVQPEHSIELVETGPHGSWALRLNARLEVWMGMPHGFVANVGMFDAARQALSAIGTFLAERLL
jgi:hypothetical protein